MLQKENWSHSKPMVIRHRNNPSFSSSLLDHICRSIDHQTPEAAAAAVVEEDLYNIGKITDQNNAIIKPTRKLYGRDKEKSASADYYFPQSSSLNSCSTSLDSSFWTSSDSDTLKSFDQSKTAVQTSFCSSHHRYHEDKKIYASQQKLKNGCGGFVKAKSKTLKVYDNLKKPNAKQPISPASRLAAFLNSLFTSTGGNARKAKIIETNYKSANEPSASSFSRSCLSKTLPSQGKSSQGAKRSVRFYPVISVIMDKDYQLDKHTDNERCRYDNICARNSICGIKEMRENNHHARELLKINYQKRIEECKMMDDNDINDDEDCESCASSDLFELDINGSKGRYCEELPVYETTSIDANRAIAHGLLV